MRISNQAVVNRLLSQIARSQGRLADVQERVGSGLRITRPSDDPAAIGRLMAARTELDRNQQYDRNIATALSDLSASEAALVRFSNVLARSSELAVQAANGTMSDAGRQAIGLEISQLLTEAINIGNTANAGRYIFSGQMTDTAPYVPDVPAAPTAVTYNGDNGVIQREISAGRRITVNVPGNAVIPQIFTTLMKFRDDLTANNLTALNADGGLIDSQLDEVLRLRSEVGVKTRSVDMARTQLEDDAVRIRTVVSEIEQADLAKTIVELQTEETTYQAALGAAGRTLGLNLLDFLR